MPKKITNKGRNCCVVCFYNQVVEKHHPKGRKEVYVMQTIEGENFETEDKRVVDALMARILQRVWGEKDVPISTTRYLYTDYRYIDPDDYYYVCPNCHKLIHHYGYTLKELWASSRKGTGLTWEENPPKRGEQHVDTSK